MLCFYYCNGHVVSRRQHFIASSSSSPYSLSTSSDLPWSLKQLFTLFRAKHSMVAFSQYVDQLFIDCHPQNKKNPLWPRLRAKHTSMGMALCFHSYQKLVEFPVASGWFFPGGVLNPEMEHLSPLWPVPPGEAVIAHFPAFCFTMCREISYMSHSIFFLPIWFLTLSFTFTYSNQYVVCMLYRFFFPLKFFSGE